MISVLPFSPRRKEEKEEEEEEEMKLTCRPAYLYLDAGKGMTRPSIHSTGNFVDIYFLAGGQAMAVE